MLRCDVIFTTQTPRIPSHVTWNESQSPHHGPWSLCDLGCTPSLKASLLPLLLPSGYIGHNTIPLFLKHSNIFLFCTCLLLAACPKTSPNPQYRRPKRDISHTSAFGWPFHTSIVPSRLWDVTMSKDLPRTPESQRTTPHHCMSLHRAVFFP